MTDTDIPTLESAVVSALLIDGDETLAKAVSKGLDSKCFIDNDCKQIFECIETHYRKTQQAPDSIQVMDALEASGDWNNLSPVYDRMIMSEVALVRFDSHLDTLLEKTHKRLSRASYEPLSLITQNSTDEEIDQLEAKHRDLSQEADTYNQANREEEKREELEELLQDAERSIRGEQPVPAISMEFLEGFQEEFTPIQRKEFVVLGATPGAGKTSMVGMVVGENLMNNCVTAVFPLESGRREFSRTVASQVSRVNNLKLKKYSPQQQQKYINTLKRIYEVEGEKIHFCQEGNIHKMQTYLDGLYRKHGKIDCIIVDYIQLVDGGNPKDSKTDRIGDCTRQMKLWCSRYDCAVIGLSQLNKEHIRDGKAPTMHSLRSSGSIGQDANRVLLMWMPPQNSEGNTQNERDEVKEIELIQDKCRFGPKGITMKLEFIGPETRFRAKYPNHNKRF